MRAGLDRADPLHARCEVEGALVLRNNRRVRRSCATAIRPSSWHEVRIAQARALIDNHIL